MGNPGRQHWEALKDILVYLRTYPDLVITYSRSPVPSLRNILETYTDSDHGGDVDTKRSTTGYAIFMNCGPISWTSKKQPHASGHGPPQSEYQSLFYGASETVWIRQVNEELGFPQPGPTIIKHDCQPSIDFAHNPVQLSRMKSIYIKYHAIRDFIRDGHVRVLKVDTKDNYSDMLTKSVSVTQLQLQRSAYLQ